MAVKRPGGDEKHALELEFGAIRFLAKSFLVFIAILTIVSLLKDFSEGIQQGMMLMAKRWWALPLLFLCWLPLHLMYDVILLYRRRELEALRSSPGAARRNQRRRSYPNPRIRRL